MDFFKYFSLFVFLTILSSLITNFIRHFSIKNKIYDIPNDRSSHDTPKPKSGGVSIVLIMTGTIGLLFFYEMLEANIAMSLLIGISIVAVTGLIDDYKNLPILVRAMSYLIAIAFSLYSIGGFTYLSINNHVLYLSGFGNILGVLFIFWMTNLYNFMDGTDGFAAIQTICVALFCGLLLFLSNNIPYAVIFLCMVSATIGFLFWNWAPAKIFMGDVGSCALGFFFGLFAIYTEKNEIMSIAVWLILLAPFIGDATFTLLKRIMNREKWYKAHNSHAYQNLYKLGMTHKQLAICLLITNTSIVWPLAYLANAYRNLEFAMMILSYFTIGAIWFVVQLKFNQSKEILS